MNKFLIFNTIFILFFFTSYSQKRYQKEGLLIHYTNLNSKEMKENRIWFKDSVIIYEMNVNNSIEYDSDTGRVHKSSYDVYKYTYLDLRTLKCQDYTYFSDTATVVCNYHLKPDEGIGCWDFYSDNSKHNITDNLPLNRIPDTTIDKQNFYRMKVIDTFGFIFIYYFNCNIKKNIFSFNKLLDNRDPGCIITRIEIIDSKSVFPKTVFEYKIVEEKLNCEENKIFKKWERNASETKLPVNSLKEVSAIPIPMPESFKKFY